LPKFLIGLGKQQLFNGPLSCTTRFSQYQKQKTNLNFTETKDSEWQYPTTLTQVLQAGCQSCCPTNSIRALKTQQYTQLHTLQNSIYKTTLKHKITDNEPNSCKMKASLNTVTLITTLSTTI